MDPAENPERCVEGSEETAASDIDRESEVSRPKKGAGARGLKKGTEVSDSKKEAEASDPGRVVERVEDEETLRSQLIRLQADFENYRKRTEAERLHASRYALEPVLPDILDVVDDIERALASPGHGGEEWKQGMEMVHRKLLAALGSKGVKPMRPVGQPFDPHHHEAVSAHASEDVQEEIVELEILKGYMLHDRVVRHAKVIVATPASEVGVEKVGEREGVGNVRVGKGGEKEGVEESTEERTEKIADNDPKGDE